MAAPVDANVKAYLQREAQLNEAKEHVYRTEFVARNAEFMAKGAAKVTAAAKTRQQKAAQTEMFSLDTELLNTRRRRLKHFYQEQYQEYQAELAAKGLSLSS